MGTTSDEKRTAPLILGFVRIFCVALSVALCVALSGAGCATPLRVAPGTEPERLLPPDAAAYVKLDKALTGLVLATLGGDAAAASAKAIVDRTDSLVLAVMPARPEAEIQPIYAVATGRYPSGAASLKLSTDRAWKKEGRGWVQSDGSLRVALASGGRLFLGTAPLDGMAAAAAKPNDEPIPDAWLDAWSADVAMYARDPLSTIGARFSLDPESIPMTALVLSAWADGDVYRASVSFGFSNDDSARVLFPICKLFMLGVARGVWTPRSAEILAAAEWSVSGSVATVSGLVLSAAELSTFFSAAGLR